MPLLSNRFALVGGGARTVETNGRAQLVALAVQRERVELTGERFGRHSVIGVNAATLVVHEENATAGRLVVEDAFAAEADIGCDADTTGPVLFVDLLNVNGREMHDEFAAAIRTGVASEPLALQLWHHDRQLHANSIAPITYADKITFSRTYFLYDDTAPLHLRWHKRPDRVSPVLERLTNRIENLFEVACFRNEVKGYEHDPTNIRFPFSLPRSLAFAFLGGFARLLSSLHTVLLDVG